MTGLAMLIHAAPIQNENQSICDGFAFFISTSLCKYICNAFSNKKTNAMRWFLFIRDLDWIQTSNLLSRNQMRYSIAPRGHTIFLPPDFEKSDNPSSGNDRELS